MENSFDYYEALKVPRSSSQDEIKRAYRKRIIACHPDHNPGDNEAEEEFKRVSEAYEVLGDPERRKHYDLLSGVIDPSNFNKERFTQIFSEFVEGISKEAMNTNQKKPPKKKKKKAAKKKEENYDDSFVVLKQGGALFRVKRATAE